MSGPPAGLSAFPSWGPQPRGRSAAEGRCETGHWAEPLPTCHAYPICGVTGGPSLRLVGAGGAGAECTEAGSAQL